MIGHRRIGWQKLVAFGTACLSLLAGSTAEAEERTVWTIARATTAAPVGTNGQLMAIGAGIGITSEASAPCIGTILGTYAENPPILPFIELAGVPKAYGVLVGGQCLIGPSDGRMAFYLAESAGIVGAMQEGKLVVFPVTELGFGAKATLGKRADSRLYISSEMGFIPLLFSPYFSVGMGWKA